MTNSLDIQAILAPFEQENPAGEDLRYTPTYDAIVEARRADDDLDRGDWQRDLKTSDWRLVVRLASDALQNKSKDLQIAVWLTEGLIHTQGFTGLTFGLQVMNGLMEKFWDCFYPIIEDDDLDYRIGPLELFNDKFWSAIKSIALTDTQSSEGYSWLKWQESRAVGFEKDVFDQHGDVDERKKTQRNELIAEGKITAEEFDAAAARSSKDYYRQLQKNIEECLEAFSEFDRLINEKFGVAGPSVSNIKSSIDDCLTVVGRIFKEKLEADPDPVPVQQVSDDQVAETAGNLGDDSAAATDFSTNISSTGRLSEIPSAVFFNQSEGREQALWEDASQKLRGGDVKKALEQLFMASCTSTSVREKNRYRLLIAKLCLKADRADLAKPILEELYTLVEDFQLERWESPVWVAELIEALYKCLTSKRYVEENGTRAETLLTRLCTIDITKAMAYR